MATANVQTLTGNRVVAEFDHKQIGLLQQCRFNDSYNLEPASGVGDIHVKEHVPTRASHSVSASSMVLYKKSMRAAGLIPENGDAALKGMVFDIAVYSKDGGEVLRKAISCSYDSGTISVDAHRIIVTDAQFRALDVQGTGL